MKTTTLKNKTDNGNVAARRIEVQETPHATGGKAHAKVVDVFRSGSENVCMGKYFPTLESAEAQEKEWIEKLLATGNFELVQ